MHEDNKENDVVKDLGQLIHSQVAGGLFDPLEIPIGKPQPLGRHGGRKHTRALAPLVLGSHACSARCNAGSGQCNAGTAGSADGDAAEAAAEAEAEAD